MFYFYIVENVQVDWKINASYSLNPSNNTIYIYMKGTQLDCYERCEVLPLVQFYRMVTKFVTMELISTILIDRKVVNCKRTNGKTV